MARILVCGGHPRPRPRRQIMLSFSSSNTNGTTRSSFLRLELSVRLVCVRTLFFLMDWKDEVRTLVPIPPLRKLPLLLHRSTGFPTGSFLRCITRRGGPPGSGWLGTSQLSIPLPFVFRPWFHHQLHSSASSLARRGRLFVRTRRSKGWRGDRTGAGLDHGRTAPWEAACGRDQGEAGQGESQQEAQA